MIVLLIRHGQSANNLYAGSHGHDYAAYMAGRHPEPPLTEIGKRQAQLLAQQMVAAATPTSAPTPVEGAAWVTAEHPIERIFVSPMLRALQTALPLSRAVGVAPQVWVDLHEHGGVFTGNPQAGDVVGYPGLTSSELLAQFAGYTVDGGVDEQGWWSGGYEEMDACYTRACRVAERLYALSDELGDVNIALVTHGTFLDALIHNLVVPGEPYGNRLHFSHLNTGVSRIDFGSERRLALRYLNRIDHLTAELLSR